MNRTTVTKYTKPLLKTLFVAGLLYFLTQKGFISLSDTKRAFEEWQYIATGFAVLSSMVILGTFRWQWLLRAQDIEMKWGRVLELTLVGNFFNIALPGAVSGDFVKAFYIGKEIPGKRARAFGSILFDRVAGLSALVLVSGVAMLLGFSSHVDTQSARMLVALRPFVVLCAAGVVIFYGYLFLVKESWDPVLILLRKIEGAAPKMSALTRIYESLRHYHHYRWTVLKVLLLSIFIHLSVGWALLNYAHALGAGHLPLLAVYTVFPLGLLVTAVPVAPAGVGTGHAAFLYLFDKIGSPRGADIFTLFALSNLILGGMGGLVYLRFRALESPVISPDATPTN